MKCHLGALALIPAVVFQIAARGKDDKTPVAPAPAPAPAGCKTLGSVIESNNQWGAGYLFGNPYWATSDIVIRSIAVEVNGAPTSFRLGIYSNNNANGTPANVLAQTNTQYRSTNGWVTFGIGPVTLTTGSRYWLMALSSTTSLACKRETGLVSKYSNPGVAAVQTPLPDNPGATSIIDATNNIVVLDCN